MPGNPLEVELQRLRTVLNGLVADVEAMRRGARERERRAETAPDSSDHLFDAPTEVGGVAWTSRTAPSYHAPQRSREWASEPSPAGNEPPGAGRPGTRVGRDQAPATTKPARPLTRADRLRVAMETGFSRAWPSIRDSNLSTLITCAILFWFGSNFGASIVKGFAITLALGLVINLFTAVVVTRTFMRVVFDVGGDGLRKNMWLLGVFRLGRAPAGSD